MATKQPKKNKKTLHSYVHADKKRTNNPPVGLVSSETDRLDGQTTYKHDPHIDPFLSWSGKQELTNFDVPDVSLHVHERIDPKRIATNFVKKTDTPKQRSIFEEPDNEPPLHQAIDFYHHSQDWTNRLVAGDSLLVMNSLLAKEGMAGKVQMIYIDPPYGIKYNSNFQPFVNKRDVKDNNDADIPAEPEMIQAFRDTWELGIHSYLTYLRNRLLLARDLLTDSGSVFVQISDENVHHVRELLDEIFGQKNFCGQIVYTKTGGLGSELLSNTFDYILWYAADRKQVKFHQLFVEKSHDAGTAKTYGWVELPDGQRRGITKEERGNLDSLPKGARVYKPDNLTSQGNPIKEFVYEGQTYSGGWKTTLAGMEVLGQEKRIHVAKNSIMYVRYLDDFKYVPITQKWDDTSTGSFTDPKIYVVQSGSKAVARCLLMTTDPGDLVLDITCGSGTTAFVAEQWGRRWITCDTSRVAVALAKQRLLTSKFEYYKLAHPDEGIQSGLEYKTAPHVTLGSIANKEQASEEILYDQPQIDKDKVRVAGPFTVEAVPSLRTKPFEGSEPVAHFTWGLAGRGGDTSRQAEWRDELKATGIRATGGKFIQFAHLESAEGSHYIHAVGEVLEEGNIHKYALVSFGPEYGPLEQRQVEEVLKEARMLAEKPAFIIFAAFQFDPEAAKDIDQIEWGDVQILKAQMSVDLLTGDLRKQRSSNQSYWLIGQPDVDLVKRSDGLFTVKVNGFDYYNPVTGEIDSGSTSRVAMWFLDTDYDERSLLPDQVFFPTGDSARDWTKLAKALNGEVNEEALDAFTGTESLPFVVGKNRKCAVKIIDDRGIESFVIKELA